MSYGKNTHKGRFIPTNPEKYRGDVNNIVYRSSWERQVFRWCDTNPDVMYYSSEEIVIPYVDKIDGTPHRYFVDMFIEFRNGEKYLIEIKPERFTKPPQQKNSKSKKYLQEVAAWSKNKSKWLAAMDFAKRNNVHFQVWTEDTLKNKLGIKII